MKLFFLGIVLCFSTSNYAADTLAKGHSLQPGQSITSQNGKYCAVFQETDGNLIAFATPQNFINGDYRGLPKKIIWHLGIQIAAPYRLQINPDGVLVIYNSDDGGKTFTPVWAQPTKSLPKDRVELKMQNDANLVLYNNSKPIWNSETHIYTKNLDTSNLISSRVVVYLLQSEVGDQNILGKISNNYLVHEGLRFVSFDKALEAHFAPGGINICNYGSKRSYARIKKLGVLNLHAEDCERWCRQWAAGRTYPVNGLCWKLVYEFRKFHHLL